MSADYTPVSGLRASHAVDAFDCGQAEPNRFLAQHALAYQRAGWAKTFVCCRDDTVVGFYSLTWGSVFSDRLLSDEPLRMPPRPEAVMILSRLAVNRPQQGQGLGSALLTDALRRTAQAASILGARSLFVQATHEPARQWYSAWGFEPSPEAAPYWLFLRIKDLKAALP